MPCGGDSDTIAGMDKFPALLIAFAVQLYELAGEIFPRGAVKDVAGWQDPDGAYAFAFMMDAVKLQSYLDASVARDRGLWSGPALNSKIRRIFQHERDLGFKWERDVYMDADFFERMGSELGIPGVDNVSVTAIPLPGYPWPTANGFYYSAKTNRAVASPQPPWLTEVPAERDADGPRYEPGVDLCRFHAPVDPTERWRASSVPDATRVEFENGAHAIVTHSMGNQGGRDWQAAAQGVRACGGFLWPSLAIGEVPASSFGAATLVAKVDVGLLAVKPFKPRGVDVARVYETDAWTWTLGQILGSGQRIAFEQLHGHARYMYTLENNLMVLGPPEGDGIDSSVDIRVIETVSSLAREVKRRGKFFPAGVSVVQQAKNFMATRYSPQRYGYLEVKSNLNVAVSAFPIAVGADFIFEDGFNRFLDEIGFNGKRLVIPTSPVVKVAFTLGARELLNMVVQEGVLTARDLRAVLDVAGDESTAGEALETWVKVTFAHVVASAVAEFGATRRL